jgi:hypothetical protein
MVPISGSFLMSLLVSLGVAENVSSVVPWPPHKAGPLPNIGYLAQGYNIYYGNPHASQCGVDPGFQTYAGYPVFQQVYSGQMTGDQRYMVPDGVNAIRDFGCALDFHSTETSKSTTYIKTLHRDVTVGFRIPFIASFRASHDYSKFLMSTTSTKKRMVSSSAKCLVYDADVSTYQKPPLTGNFKVAVQSLPSDYGTGEAFFDFLDTFGTHTLSKVKMGSRFGFSGFFGEMASMNVDRTGTSVSTAASIFGLYMATKNSQSTNVIKTFKENIGDYQEISLGVKPTEHADAEKWEEQVIQEPMPISYTLVPICDAIDGWRDTEKRANCEKALRAEEYCTKRVKGNRKDVEDCVGAEDVECIWDADCGKGVCVNSHCRAGAHQIEWRPSSESDSSKLCLEVAPGQGAVVRLELCKPGSANQMFVFNSAEYQDYMQIQLSSNTALCLDGGSMANGQALRVASCSGAASQTWARDIAMGAAYLPNGPSGYVCMDAGSGITAGKSMLVWQCNLLPQQQYDIFDYKPLSSSVIV